MHFLAATAIFAATALALPSLESRTKCMDEGVHVIAVGGQDTVANDLGYLMTLVTNITAKIPHSDYEQIPYPPGVIGAPAVAYAMPLFNQAIVNYAAQCPNSKIVLASYSIGGAVDMNTLCGAAATGTGAISTQYTKNVLANVVYGDVTYVPNQPYDVGTCTTSGGLVTRVDPAACGPWGALTHSYCDENDLNCCGGTSLAVHFSYPGIYDLTASSWVQSQWEAYKASPQYHPPKKSSKKSSKKLSSTVSHKKPKPTTTSHKPKVTTTVHTHKSSITHKPKPTTVHKSKSKTSTKSEPKPSSHHKSASKGSKGSKASGDKGSHTNGSGSQGSSAPTASSATALVNFFYKLVTGS